ncbi:hypothetical protein [Hahella ganghwensis]|uniref:hypothetical protein n=1 Tax=Hahella ganghwensis TaxID=286420 RepID=UPI00036AA011|nr:hypothetical protein [Hahella ganghwensis]
MSKKHREIRQLLTREAARLMHEESVEQYLDAKRMASKRLLGKGTKYLTKYLPSNGEIAEELHRISKFHMEENHQSTLFEMRMLAMDIMVKLAPFWPRLIGSVSTGRIRQGSDIDIHVFCDHPEQLYQHLDELGWGYETRQISIQRNSRQVEYTHIYLAGEYPIELSVYPANDIRVTGRSSTDGKPINRLSASRLRELIEEEHQEAWNLSQPLLSRLEI